MPVGSPSEMTRRKGYRKGGPDARSSWLGQASPFLIMVEEDLTPGGARKVESPALCTEHRAFGVDERTWVRGAGYVSRQTESATLTRRADASRWGHSKDNPAGCSRARPTPGPSNVTWRPRVTALTKGVSAPKPIAFLTHLRALAPSDTRWMAPWGDRP